MKHDGGPAFPRPASEDTHDGTLLDGNIAVPAEDGMSLRDYFAARALDFAVNSSAGESGYDYTAAAVAAYKIADAMLLERKENR